MNGEYLKVNKEKALVNIENTLLNSAPRTRNLDKIKFNTINHIKKPSDDIPSQDKRYYALQL